MMSKLARLWWRDDRRINGVDGVAECPDSAHRIARLEARVAELEEVVSSLVSVQRESTSSKELNRHVHRFLASPAQVRHREALRICFGAAVRRETGLYQVSEDTLRSLAHTFSAFVSDKRCDELAVDCDVTSSLLEHEETGALDGEDLVVHVVPNQSVFSARHTKWLQPGDGHAWLEVAACRNTLGPIETVAICDEGGAIIADRADTQEAFAALLDLALSNTPRSRPQPRCSDSSTRIVLPRPSPSPQPTASPVRSASPRPSPSPRSSAASTS